MEDTCFIGLKVPQMHFRHALDIQLDTLANDIKGTPVGTPLRVRRGRGVYLATFPEKPFRFVFLAHEYLYINML